jgi:hypothetical protein
MIRVYLTFILILFTLNGCLSLKSPFSSRSAIEIKEGYLSIKSVNINLDKQMPLTQKVSTNEIKIASATIFAAKNGKNLVTEIEFIFKSFQIPEGLPAIARVYSDIDYNPKTKEFKLVRITTPEIRFLKENLLEYVTPQQRKFIPDTIILKLYTLVLHKSKRELGSMKSFSIKEGKIKILFR